MKMNMSQEIGYTILAMTELNYSELEIARVMITMRRMSTSLDEQSAIEQSLPLMLKTRDVYVDHIKSIYPELPHVIDYLANEVYKA
jgi:hypothetical protein